MMIIRYLTNKLIFQLLKSDIQFKKLNTNGASSD